MLVSRHSPSSSFRNCLFRIMTQQSRIHTYNTKMLTEHGVSWTVSVPLCNFTLFSLLFISLIFCISSPSHPTLNNLFFHPPALSLIYFLFLFSTSCHTNTFSFIPLFLAPSCPHYPFFLSYIFLSFIQHPPTFFLSFSFNVILSFSSPPYTLPPFSFTCSRCRNSFIYSMSLLDNSCHPHVQHDCFKNT